MAENTKIEWADATVNHWAGCTKVSPACDQCYAERMAKRLWGVEWGAGQPRKKYVSSRDMLEALDRKARRLGRPLRVFHNSLSDFFDNEVPGAWRAQALQVMKDTPNLIHLLLTKRIGNAARMLDEAAELMDSGMGVWAPSVFPHVWIGATVVNQEEAERDIPKLLRVPAAKRFLSLEPLLSSVIVFSLDGPLDVPEGFKSPIDWVIVGGESGHGARPMHPDWVRCLREQCLSVGVPFFFKQWGEWADMGAAQISAAGPSMTKSGHVSDWLRQRIQHADGSARNVDAYTWTGHATELMYRVGKKAAGRMLDGRTWDEVPT